MGIKWGTQRVAIIALLVAGCTSTAELDEALAKEKRAEDIIESVEALPADTPGRDVLLADAREAEATLEAQRKALEKLTRDGLIGTGIDAATDAARGDYLGALEALLATLGAGAVVWLRRRQKVDLEELERRRDESRAMQGIQPSRLASMPLAAPPAGGTAPTYPAAGAAPRAPYPQAAAPQPSAAPFIPESPLANGPGGRD